jgi:hypothetical protein
MSVFWMMVERYTANVIAENLYSQCDSKGRQFLVLDEIIDHAKDNSYGCYNC